MKVEINQQSAEKAISFKAGDIIVIEGVSRTYAHLASSCLAGVNEWVLVDLRGETRWTAPTTYDKLLEDLERTHKSGSKVTVIPANEAVLKLNI